MQPKGLIRPPGLGSWMCQASKSTQTAYLSYATPLLCSGGSEMWVEGKNYGIPSVTNAHLSRNQQAMSIPTSPAAHLHSALQRVWNSSRSRSLYMESLSRTPIHPPDQPVQKHTSQAVKKANCLHCH